MSGEAEAVAILRQSGHKLTPQRLMVVSALQRAKGHMSAAQILEQVQQVYPYVDISTVYRTVAVLKELRLVTETDMGGGELAYEWVTDQPHHHLICHRCAGIQQLGHSALEALSQQLLEGYGFQADMHHFAIFGICRDCLMSVPAGARSGTE